MTKIEKRIPLAKPIVTDAQKKAMLKVLECGRYILGENNQKLEEEFATYCGTKYGVTVNSGTAALYLSLIALGIGKGHEVITVSNTYIATANAVVHVGAKPVFVDIDPETYTLNPKEIEKSISKNTKAILPVHLYGHPVEMDSILEIAREHNLYVVEDACQAHGALYKGKRVGSLGDVGCFSFYPSKNMTVCGDGGIIVTNNEEIMEKIRALRDQGQKGRYLFKYLGFNLRLSELHAAIGREQLRNLEQWNSARRRHATKYNSLLKEVEEVIRPVERIWARHVYHYYIIRISKRDELQNHLQSRGIEAGIHYPTPIHLQPVYEQLYGLPRSGLPITERITKQILSLPCHPKLSNEDITFIVNSIKEFDGEKKWKQSS